MEISILDACIVGFYLLTLLFIGYFSGKNNKNQEDYFLAGKNMPWIPIGLSVAATMISANGFIGGPGWAYNDGMYPVMVNITVPLALFFASYITMPVIYNMKITSIYQYMQKRLGEKSRNLTLIQYFINSLIQISSMIFIPCIIIQLITGLSFYILVPIVVVVAICYTILGGIKAVIWTDALQMIVVIGSVFLIIYTSINGIEGTFLDIMFNVKDAGKLNALDFSLDLTKTNTFWVTLIGGSFMWIRYFCFDQGQVQRVLTARSLKASKNSFVMSAIVMNVIYYLMLFIGVLFYAFYNGKSFETSNEIMIHFILNNLPIGIRGLVIASVLAAAMSSVDSILNSMTAVFTKDIYEYYFSKEETPLKVTMIQTVIVGIIIIIFVIFGFGSSTKSILELVGSYISYFSGPACGAFILAMFTKKANDNGVSLGFIIGLVLGYIIATIYSVSWLLNPAIGGSITIVCGYVFSLFFKNEKKEEDILKYTAIGMRNEIIKSGNIMENGSSILPFTFGKHEFFILTFFIIQYIILILIQY